MNTDTGADTDASRMPTPDALDGLPLDVLKRRMKEVKQRMAEASAYYVKLWFKALELGATMKELEQYDADVKAEAEAEANTNHDSRFVVKGSMPEFASLKLEESSNAPELSAEELRKDAQWKDE